MSRTKLLLDEDVWLGLAGTLRDRGFDVVHVYEVQRGEMSDADQLAYAAQENRVLLTHNAKDFERLAAEYFFGARPHAGLIVSPQISKGALVRRATRLLSSLSAEDVAGTVRYLSDYR